MKLAEVALTPEQIALIEAARKPIKNSSVIDADDDDIWHSKTRTTISRLSKQDPDYESKLSWLD